MTALLAPTAGRIRNAGLGDYPERFGEIWVCI